MRMCANVCVCVYSKFVLRIHKLTQNFYLLSSVKTVDPDNSASVMKTTIKHEVKAGVVLLRFLCKAACWHVLGNYRWGFCVLNIMRGVGHADKT